MSHLEPDFEAFSATPSFLLKMLTQNDCTENSFLLSKLHYDQVYAPLDLDIHMCLLNFPFQIYSHFAVIIITTFLGRPSTRVWSMAVGISSHSTDINEKT